MTPDTPLRELDEIGPQRSRQLAKLGLSTVRDLVLHYPRRYEDRRQFDHFPTGESDGPVCICGTVARTSFKRLRGRRNLFEITLEEENPHALSPTIVCRWFNAYFVQKLLATGQRVVVYGKPRRRGRAICIDHPEFEVVEDDDTSSLHVRRIAPIHKATSGISTRLLRTLVGTVLERISFWEDLMPRELDDLSTHTALRWIHFPENWDQVERARRHLVLAEFFAMQLVIARKRAETRSRPGSNHCGSGKLMARLHASLPFALTQAQRRAIDEIRRDLAFGHPMNRLLHGEVGSGKTFVAMSAMLLAVEAGYQSALMAPTQVLAEQHYLTFRRWLEPLDIRLALRTGDRNEETSLPLFDATDEHEPQIVIGTHALLYDRFEFVNLGLAVIDEQHKFGVKQRARLMEQAAAPDVLVMTATPIPRTLTMTVYGDLDVSTLDELPANRGRIVTAVRDQSKLPEAVKFVREHLAHGRQAYIVYPLIEESATLEAKAAAREHETWTERLRPLRCELLHGRIDPDEKEAAMKRFRSGETRVLVATSVIEVGIDVPNATIMLVENAERFGLAQLHQLRGRIGRGTCKSYCILITGTESADAHTKLKILEECSNGFDIAEADLRMRGPGDILGTAQSGLPPLRLGNFLADASLMRIAREAAARILSEDPRLESEQNRRFRKVLEKTEGLALSQIS